MRSSRWRSAPQAPPAPDDVLVEVAAAGVNFIDVYQREGVYPVATPFVSGNEGAGTVVAVGSDVTLVAPGDRVAWPQSLGSATRYAVLPAALLVPVPDSVDLDIAAAVMLQGLTAHYLTTSTFAVAPGDVALVHAAAGGVGQLLVQLVHARGGTVVATAGGPEKCATARDLGAEHVIDYRASRTSRQRCAGSPAGGASTSRTTGSARTPSTRRWHRCDRGGCSRCSGRPAGRSPRSTSSGSTPRSPCS